MVKPALISFVLLSSSFCFAQSTKSDEKINVTKNVTNGSVEKVKPSLDKELVGNTPLPINTDSLQVILYNPANETTDKKSYSSDKNSSIPH